MTDAAAQLIDRLRRRQLPPPEEAKAIRQRAGATRAEIAEVLGVSLFTVVKWETGDRNPSREKAEAYAHLLHELERLAEGEVA